MGNTPKVRRLIGRRSEPHDEAHEGGFSESIWRIHTRIRSYARLDGVGSHSKTRGQKGCAQTRLERSNPELGTVFGWRDFDQIALGDITRGQNGAKAHPAELARSGNGTFGVIPKRSHRRAI